MFKSHFYIVLAFFCANAFGLAEENICDSDICAQVCEPVGDSYKCDCFKGYTLMEDGVSCKPQKRALKKGGRCELNNPCDHDCTDTGTEIKCSCRGGYELAADGRTCKDIDECILNLHECMSSEECINELGTYSCYESSLGENTDIDFDKKCPPGYKFNIEKEVCDDINECQFELMCVAPKICKNTIGSFLCEQDITQCLPGFYFNTETKICDDVDECAQDSVHCKNNEKCINQPGGYTCIEITTSTSTTTTTTTTTVPTTKAQTTATTTRTTPRTTTTKKVTCPQGYLYIKERNVCEDINECQMGLHTCDVAQRCDNTVGSYHCSRIYGCGTGYTLNTANGLCEDDDECVLETHNCKQLGPKFRCKNTLGSYRCEPIRNRPQNTESTTVSTTSTSSTPYVVTVRSPNITTVSSESSTSVKTTPSVIYHSFSYPVLHTTSTRPSSFHIPTLIFKPQPSTPATLPYYSPRVTTPAPVRRLFPTDLISGQLKKCLPGYKMNLRGECEDINECESNPCARHEKCLNYNGRYACASPMQCKRGYELTEAGDQCIDINECSRGIHKCNPSQICKNHNGYYTCECPAGHHLKFDQCEDIDECKLFRPCGTAADCMNTKGSYTCRCREGFRENSNLCQEIDECTEISGLCQHNCVNTWGSYRCSCNLGFTLNNDNRTCTDIDECQRFKDKRLCIGKCVNVPGSYACECPRGYKLGSDGVVCIDIDECKQHNACLREEICLNTRGSYKCYSIKCPQNYIKDVDHKARCKRMQSACDPRDYQCLLMPDQYTYQYMTLVSNLPLSNGHIQLFQLRGPQWNMATAEFTLTLLDVICPKAVPKVDASYFQKINGPYNSMFLYLVKPITGPQEIKLQIQMRLSQGNANIGNAIVYIIIVVSEHTF